MSDNKKQIIKQFQSMKPSVAFKQLDFSKFHKEVRDSLKASLAELSNDTLDLQFDQSTFKKWIEDMADMYPAVFGIKEDKKETPLPSAVKKSTEVVPVESENKLGDLETKVKDLETRLGVVKKMIAKQPAKRAELKIRMKTIEKMIVKFKEDLKKAKVVSKKKVIKKSLGGFLLGAVGGFIAGQLVDLKLQRKKVRFDLGGTLEGDKKYQYSVTYQTITPESAEEGDFDDSGFEVEKTIDELQDILQEAVNRYGIHEPSSTKNENGISSVTAGCWWSSVSPDNNRDYFEKGIEKYYSLHIYNVDGSELTQEESQLITNKLKEGRKLHWDEEEKNWWKDGGEIHSKDTDGTLVFKADTKGGKYSIEVREGASGNLMNYDIRDYTNGSLRGMSFIGNKELLMHKLIDTILGSKKIDGINYIISHDDLGVKEYLPASEKIWDIYNSAEFREWFKKQNETLTEEQKQSLSDELKNKTIKYVRDNGYKQDDSTIGTFFQLFRKERLIKDFYESKGMVMLKDGGELKKIIKFASLSSKINGYDNIVYEDENGLSFARKAEFERGISPNAKKLALIQSNGEVVKYENGGDVTRKVYSYKTFKDNGIDVFKYLRDEKGDNPHEYTLDVVISKVKKDKDVLIPNLKLKYPELLLLQGYDADMKEKFDVELFACKIYSIFGQPTEKEKEICEEKLSKSYRKTYDGYKKLKNGGDVQTQEWLSNMNQERLNELKALRAEIEETMAEDFVETTGGSGRTKAQILADFDSSIAVRENKNFENGGGVYSIPYDTETTGVFKLVADGVNTTIRLAGAEKNDSDTYSFYQFDTDRNDEIGSIIVNNRAIDKLSKGVTVIGTGSKNGIKYKITRVSNVFENGGGVGNVESEINDLYSKSNFINDSFNWKMKLLEMLQDRSIEAYNVYQSLNANQKEEVLQALFEADNDMGSDGDGELSTSKENLEILLEDAKNGNKYSNGGGVGKSVRGFEVGDTFYKTPSTSGDTRYYKITSIDDFYVKADDYDYVRNGTDVNTGRKSSFTTGSFGYKVDEHEISRYERGDLSYANGGGIGKAIENLHEKASSSTTPRGKNKLKIPSNEMSFSAEEQKSWGADKIKFYDSYVDAHNKIQDLKEELKQAKLRKDKELIKSLELRIATNEHAKKTSKEYFDKYSDGGSISSDNTPKVYIADLAAYNEGSLVGEWLDLSEFGSGEEVMEKISELLKQWSEESDEEREEFAVHDMENFPKQMYSEYMGESDFQKVIDYWEAINGTDYPMEVVEDYASETGKDIVEAASEIKDNHYGTFSSLKDFAYEWVDSVGGISGVSRPEQYIEVSETDKRIISQEQADSEVDDLDDNDILERADLKDTYDSFNERADELGEDEELDDDDRVRTLESEFGYADSDEILEEAKEKVKEEISNEWEKGLDDAYNFLVEEKGLYSSDNLIKQSFIRFDYEAFGKDLEQDFTTIEHDGEVYVFNNN